jgi:sulfide dehydrogenase [flavocytochrome c] flavoprotein chain
MMTGISRRDFARLAGATGFGTLTASVWSPFVAAQGSAKVVVVGGGAGGATVAHSLKKEAPELDVTLIEANPIYSSSFFSNLYIGGFRTLESLNHTYGGLTRLGVKVVHDTATDVDTAKRTVKTRGGRSYAYDRLVLSPGIDVKYDSIAGYSREVSRAMPHAYTTSADGKRLLKRQLQAMRDGGTVVMVTPNNPFRCPPGPYERACMIAHFIKTKKPKSKLVILDPKKAFSKQPVFTEAFQKYYKDVIELNLTTDIDDFAVARIDPKTKEIITKAGKKVKADVANIIPQQRAGEIAAKAGCTEGDWCPINPENFSSKKVKDVFVLGDASVAVQMPKSAFSANSQAKVVAAEILAELAKKDKFPARYRNTCWSLVAPDDCINVGGNYAPAEGRLAESDAFVSKRDESADVRKQNYQESIGWYAAITSEMFAKPQGSPAANQKKAG